MLILIDSTWNKMINRLKIAISIAYISDSTQRIRLEFPRHALSHYIQCD